jgi:hypothetical protein
MVTVLLEALAEVVLDRMMDLAFLLVLAQQVREMLVERGQLEESKPEVQVAVEQVLLGQVLLLMVLAVMVERVLPLQ